MLIQWIPVSLLMLVCAVISFTVTSEDAYISFRYAENIADGYGFVFNEGGRVVEGYSNPTWVLLLTIASKAGLSTIIAGRCLGLLFGILLIYEIILLVGISRGGRMGPGTMAAAAVITAPAMLFWLQAGLENSLFLYLLVLGWRLALQEDLSEFRFPYSAAAFFLLAITRPEGIMYSVIFGAWKIVALARKSGKKGIKRLLLWAALIIIPFALFLIWRYSVFGEWVPNTFFARVNNGIRANFRSGSRYILTFLNDSLWAPLIIPVAISLIPGRKMSEGARRILHAAVILSVVLLLFILYVGGDIHPNDRFCLPFILFSAIATFVMVPGMPQSSWWKRVSTWALIAFILGNLGYSFTMAYGIEPAMGRPPNFLTANIAGLISGRKTPSEIWKRFTDPPPDALEFIGRDLNANPEINGLIATGQCGKIPYFSELPTLDLLGLNEPEVAHIVHSVSTWDKYANKIMSHLPETFVMVYRVRHFISRYYIENTVLSEPFRSRYELDAIYHMEYYFIDSMGVEHTFPFEMIRYRPISEDSLVPLTEEEREWFMENQPIVEDPDRLGREVEAFRERYSDDPDKVIFFRAGLN